MGKYRCKIQAAAAPPCLRKIHRRKRLCPKLYRIAL